MLCTNLLGRKVSLIQGSLTEGDKVEDTGEIVAVGIEDRNELVGNYKEGRYAIQSTQRGLVMFVYSNKWKRVVRWSTDNVRFDS